MSGVAEISLRAVRLSRWYGRITALEDVSLHLGPGAYGLLGPNGSGKTTLLRLAAGQLRPSLGEIRLNGLAPFGEPRALAHVGLCPEADALYDELSALEVVSTAAELAGFRRAEARERAAAALATFDLTAAMERRVGGFSRGMRQRVKLAQSIVHSPSVLLLDEPLTGTDPISRAAILGAVRARVNAGALVLFSTHVLHEVEALTDKVLVVVRGQVVAVGMVGEIRALLTDRPHTIRVVCDRPRELTRALLGDASVLSARFVAGDVVALETAEPDRTYDAIATAVAELGLRVRAMTSPDATLEALFHHLVERSSRMAGTGADAAVGRHGADR